MEFDILKKKHEALLIQNKSNLETIAALKKRNTELEKEASKKQEKISKPSKSKECQTMSEKIVFPCKNCIYQATCEDELKWHLEEEHEFSDLYERFYIICKYCDHKTNAEYELKTHIKRTHPEKLNVCSFFLEGKCMFEDDICWYSHNL